MCVWRGGYPELTGGSKRLMTLARKKTVLTNNSPVSEFSILHHMTIMSGVRP